MVLRIKRQHTLPSIWMRHSPTVGSPKPNSTPNHEVRKATAPRHELTQDRPEPLGSAEQVPLRQGLTALHGKFSSLLLWRPHFALPRGGLGMPGS